jgi:hypothetical protein
MTQLERFQKVAFWVAVGCATIGFLTSTGCQMLPDAPRQFLLILHPLLFALGAVFGVAAQWRGEEIDRERWQIVEDPLLTSGERDWAHKNAERKRRGASTAFLAAPLALGYWLAHQIEGRGVAAGLLAATAVLGAVTGLLLARFLKPGTRVD